MSIDSEASWECRSGDKFGTEFDDEVEGWAENHSNEARAGSGVVSSGELPATVRLAGKQEWSEDCSLRMR